MNVTEKTLEQQIAEIEKAIQDKGQQVEVLKGEMRALTAQLNPLLAKKRAVDLLGEDEVQVLAKSIGS